MEIPSWAFLSSSLSNKESYKLLNTTQSSNPGVCYKTLCWCHSSHYPCYNTLKAEISILAYVLTLLQCCLGHKSKKHSLARPSLNSA